MSRAPRAIKFHGHVYRRVSAAPKLQLKAGDKVRFKPGFEIDLESAMLGVLQLGGLTGVVRVARPDQVWIKLDKHLPAIDEWQNQIGFHPGRANEGHGEFDLNLIDRYVEKL
jgi:hypothetical protein